MIYVIDSSDHAQLERSKEILGSIMANDLLMGKPMLIMSNKQDLPGALDSLDICDYFEVRRMLTSVSNSFMLSYRRSNISRISLERLVTSKA